MKKTIIGDSLMGRQWYSIASKSNRENK